MERSRQGKGREWKGLDKAKERNGKVKTRQRNGMERSRQGKGMEWKGQDKAKEQNGKVR